VEFRLLVGEAREVTFQADWVSGSTIIRSRNLALTPGLCLSKPSHPGC